MARERERNCRKNVSPTLEHAGEAGEDGGMASKEQLTLTKRARTVRKKLREIERIAALPMQNLNEDQKEKLASKDTDEFSTTLVLRSAVFLVSFHVKSEMLLDPRVAGTRGQKSKESQDGF